MQPSSIGNARNGTHGQAWLAGLVLALATVATYSPVLSHDFVNFDDNLYVT